MLVAATLCAGLWYRWPAALASPTVAPWIRQIGEADTVAASVYFTAMVAAAYLPAEYILRRRAQSWLDQRAMNDASSGAHSDEDRREKRPRSGPPGLPSGSILGVFGQALAALTPLVVALVQSALSGK